MEVVFTFCGSVFSRTVLAPLAMLITTREFTLTEREKKQRREQRGRERERARREEVREREREREGWGGERISSSQDFI